MSATDLTFLELQTLVYRELKAPNTSEAYPLEWIKELLNEGYVDVFNEPKKNLYLREASVEFPSAADTYATGAGAAIGDVTVNVVDTTNFPNSGKFLAGQEWVSYTGKTATSFTGCTGINTPITSDIPIRAAYLLTSLASDIDEQQIRAVLIDGEPYDFHEDYRFFSNAERGELRWSLFDGRLILSLSSGVRKIYVQYFKKVTPMTLDAETPALLPNSFRRMLVFYAVGRAMLADDKRTGWEQYYQYNEQSPEKSSGLYFRWLRKLYAKYGRRIDSTRKWAGSVHD